MSYKKVKISDIGKIVSGATPKTKDVDNYGGSIAWITPADLSGYTSKYISHGSRNITQKGYDSCSTHLMPRGTVLFSSRAPIGYVAIAENPICTNQGFKSIVPNDDIDSEFLYYQLQYLRKKIQEKGSGTTFKEISGKVLGETDIVAPSLEEQFRIVARIEELFSELDKAVDTLKTTKEQLEVYRQAVLKDAFSDFEKKDSIRNLTMVVTSGSRGWAKYYSNSGALFVRIGNLTHSGIDIDFRDIQHITPPNNAEGVRTRLQPNDVLVSITADLGSIGFVSEKVEEAYINQHIALVRFQNPVQGRFMAWYLRSEYGQKDLLKNKRGGGKLGLGLDDIRDTPVPIVDNVTATEIVDKVEEQLSVCDSIEKTVDTALAQADAMRQSILKQAFKEGSI